MKVTKQQLRRIIKEERARLIEQSAGNRQLNVKFVEQSNAYDQTEWVFSLNGEEIEVLSSGRPSADFLAEDIVSRWGEDQDPPVDETPAFEGLVDDVERQLLASPGFADALEDAAAAVDRYAQDQYGEEW
jgi:hypothetical protein